MKTSSVACSWTGILRHLDRQWRGRVSSKDGDRNPFCCCIFLVVWGRKACCLQNPPQTLLEVSRSLPEQKPALHISYTIIFFLSFHSLQAINLLGICFILWRNSSWFYFSFIIWSWLCTLITISESLFQIYLPECPNTQWMLFYSVLISLSLPCVFAQLRKTHNIEASLSSTC
jgi:hypothetical protein